MSYRVEHNEQTNTRVYVYFSLSGEDLVPDEISKAFGIDPDESWRKGDKRRPERAKSIEERKRLSEHTFGRWKLNAPCSQGDEAEDQIEQLLTHLERLPSSLRHYIEKFDGGIVVAFYSWEDSFGFAFPTMMIQRLAYLGLQLVLDIYYVDSNDNTDTK